MNILIIVLDVRSAVKGPQPYDVEASVLFCTVIVHISLYAVPGLSHTCIIHYLYSTSQQQSF